MEYTTNLVSLHELDEIKEVGALIKITACFCEFFKLNLREIDRVFNNLTIHFMSQEKNAFFLMPVVVLLCVIKVKEIDLYRNLKENTVSYTDFIKITNLNGISKEYYVNTHPDYFLTCFKCCLMSDKEVENLREDDVKALISELIRNGIERRKIIKNSCANIEMFRFLSD